MSDTNREYPTYGEPPNPGRTGGTEGADAWGHPQVYPTADPGGPLVHSDTNHNPPQPAPYEARPYVGQPLRSSRGSWVDKALVILPFAAMLPFIIVLLTTVLRVSDDPFSMASDTSSAFGTLIPLFGLAVAGVIVSVVISTLRRRR